MKFITCSKCGFTETIDETFLETSVTYENENGEPYDVFCLECPKCGERTGYEF